MIKIKEEAKHILDERFGAAIGMFFSMLIIPYLVCVIIDLVYILNMDLGQYNTTIDTSVKFAEYAAFVFVAGILAVSKRRVALNMVNREKSSFKKDILYGGRKFYKSILMYIIINFVSIMSILILSSRYFFLLIRRYRFMYFPVVLLMVVLIVFVKIMLSQSYYIMAEDNKKSIIKCITESIELMEDNKMRLLKIILSFGGWYLLIISSILSAEFLCSGGMVSVSGFKFIVVLISILLLNPYIELTLALFHMKIKKEQSEIEEFILSTEEVTDAE